jgi:hypothetical protein
VGQEGVLAPQAGAAGGGAAAGAAACAVGAAAGMDERDMEGSEGAEV